MRSVEVEGVNPKKITVELGSCKPVLVDNDNEMIFPLQCGQFAVSRV